jgi:hypothetical protein
MRYISKRHLFFTPVTGDSMNPTYNPQAAGAALGTLEKHIDLVQYAAWLEISKPDTKPKPGMVWMLVLCGPGHYWTSVFPTAPPSCLN